MTANRILLALVLGIAAVPAPADVCSAPAAINLAAAPSGTWIVVFREGTDAAKTTAALAKSHGFTAAGLYENVFQGFFAELTQQQVSALRCEASVELIIQNQQVPLP